MKRGPLNPSPNPMLEAIRGTGKYKALMQVLEDYSGKFKVDDFTVEILVTAACSLSANGHNRTKCFLEILNQYPGIFTREHFVTCVESGKLRGLNVLMALVISRNKESIAKDGEFWIILEQYPHIFQREDFLATINHTSVFNNYAGNILTLLAAYQPKLLNEILRQYSKIFTREDLTAKLQVNGKDSSVIRLLSGCTGQYSKHETLLTLLQ